MSLINLGSRVAFEAMLSLATVALMASYLMSIGCALSKRLRGEDLPAARWSLGRYGMAVNIIALAYTSWSVSCIVRLLRTEVRLLMQILVLLGILADHLSRRQLYVQLGMSSISTFSGLRSPNVPFSWERCL